MGGARATLTQAPLLHCAGCRLARIKADNLSQSQQHFLPVPTRKLAKMGDRLTQLQDAVDQVSLLPTFELEHSAKRSPSWRNNSSHASISSTDTTIAKYWALRTR